MFRFSRTQSRVKNGSDSAVAYWLWGNSGRMGVPRFPGRISMGPNEKDAAEIERA